MFAWVTGRGQAIAPTMDELAWVTGRGQAIAPTMDELREAIERSIVGAMACPRPGLFLLRLLCNGSFLQVT